MILDLERYETTALCAGWTCTWCGAELEPAGTHYVNPLEPDGAFCRPECAAAHAERECRKSTANPRQVGLAL